MGNGFFSNFEVWLTIVMAKLETNARASFFISLASIAQAVAKLQTTLEFDSLA